MNGFGLLLLSLFVSAAVRGAEPLPYAPAPNDSYWSEQWYLENLDTNAVRVGYDINTRGAWPLSRGAGVTIAIVDDGVELSHPDLTNRAASEFHWNFETDIPAGNHALSTQSHGTPVAGLAAAEGNNQRGVIGVAPEARFASWNIYSTTNPAVLGPFVNSNQLAKMFQFHKDEVAIQNHSWVKPGIRMAGMNVVEDTAISNAVFNGRSGKGVVMVRAAGNDRGRGRNVNDDAYTADPRVITVAALRSDGTVASYSNPGAPILVSAPGGEIGFGLFTTDRLGALGFNFVQYFNSDLGDYTYPTHSQIAFTGTSASAPLISGIAALILSANPALSYRDVQQIMILAAFQTDPNDPDIKPNGAGFPVGHNSGYGLVNAGTAVDLARHWSNRPPLVLATNTVVRQAVIPDAGLRVRVTSSAALPPDLESIIALPSVGIQADGGTPLFPLVYVGDAAAPLTTNLSGKAALIIRGNANYSQKIQNAANAGAAFAIIYDNQGTTELELMGETDYVSIPAVFISQRDGNLLANAVTNASTSAQLQLATADYDFNISDSLLCEQVRVQVAFSHQQRGDLRLSLLSPMGTRSVLQRLGLDTNSFTGTWTYMTTHHFYENSQGNWRVSLSDEAEGGLGTVDRVSLIVSGVRIKDADKDGLDDDWEMAHFSSLQYGPSDDPDQDGYSNAREQILGTDPARNENTLALDLSLWSESIVRINWPSRSGKEYEILATDNLRNAFSVIGTVDGGFPRSSWYGRTSPAYQFFTVREKQ